MDKNTTKININNNIRNQKTVVGTLGSSIPSPSDYGFFVTSKLNYYGK